MFSEVLQVSGWNRVTCVNNIHGVTPGKLLHAQWTVKTQEDMKQGGEREHTDYMLTVYSAQGLRVLQIVQDISRVKHTDPGLAPDSVGI